MKFQGSVTINAPQEIVWKYLTDPEKVSSCIPGMQSLEIVTPDKKFNVVASIGFGSVKAVFNSTIEWLELSAPERARMKVHGTAPGSAVDVISEMVLSSAGDGVTNLDWSADVKVVGTIASLASRMMPGMTKKLSGAFFDCIKAIVEE